MNETLEAMAQALFKSWFVDFDPVMDKALAQGNPIPEALQAKAERRKAVVASGKYKALPQEIMDLFPAAFVYSEALGKWIPEGWEVGTVSQLISLIGGGTPKTSVSEYWNGNIGWFSVVDAPNDSDVFVFDTQKKITQKGLHNSSTKLLRKGITIISARGTVGKCALVSKDTAMNQSCYGIESNYENSDYFNYYLIRISVSILQKNAHGSVFNTITRNTFSSIKTPLFSELLSRKFDSSVKTIMARIELNGISLQSLKLQRDLLLSQLISGKTRLPASFIAQFSDITKATA